MSRTDALSPQCLKVLDVLTRAGQPLSAYDVLEQLRQGGIKSPPTVYRALERLIGLGIVHRIESLNAYMACHHGHDHPHGHEHVAQFAICTGCGHVEEIENRALMEALKNLRTKFLATIDRKLIELSGLCHKCTRQAGA